MRSRASQRGKDRKRDPRDKWGIMKRRRGGWGMERRWVNRPEKTGGFYKGNNKRLTVKSQIFVRSEVKTLWVCFIISHQVLISCTIDNSCNCVWSHELSVQASSALRPPFQPFISMLIKAFETLFSWHDSQLIRAAETWCVTSQSFTVSFVMLPSANAALARSSFVILGVVWAGVPPLCRSQSSFCICYFVFLLSALWRGQDFSWNTNWCHLAGYFKWNGPWLPLYVRLISLLHYKLPACRVSSFLCIFCSLIFLVLHSLHLQLSPPPFFLILSCFPLK